MTTQNWADGLDPLLRECHRRLATGRPVASVTLPPLDRSGQDSVADLLGLGTRPRPGQRVRLDDVAVAVERLSGQLFDEALTGLFGPIGNHAADRADAAAARAGLWSWLRDHPVVRRLELEVWAAALESGGVREGVDVARANLERALLVLDQLPASGEPLPVLAGRALNDTHALDPGSSVSTLVLGAVAHRQGAERPTTNSDRRLLWRSVGVSDDALSSTVLVAGLDAVGDTPADRTCRLGRADGRAVVLTLADVRAGAPTLATDGDVFVVENPAVLWLALTDLGTELPPIVCLSGWPSTAGTALLTGLARSGARLRYHGDLDGEGVRIAAHVIAETGALPWRMSVADYRDRVASRGAPVGRVTAAPWDEQLTDAMTESGVAVLEETVWEDLRDDLATARDLRSERSDGPRRGPSEPVRPRSSPR